MMYSFWQKDNKTQYSYDKISQFQTDFDWTYNPLFHKLEVLPPAVALKWADRFSPLEATQCEWVLAKVFENFLGYVLPKRAEALRTLLSEMQNLLWHISYIANVLKACEDQMKYEQAMFIRENLYELNELWTGARVLPQFLCLGGVDKDLSIGVQQHLQKYIVKLEEHSLKLIQDIQNDNLLKLRLKNFLKLEANFCKSLNLSGIHGQACGLDLDLRRSKKQSYYSKLEVKSFAQELPDECNADAYSRLMASIFQLKQSYYLMKLLLIEMPAGQCRVEVADYKISPKSVQYAVVEAGSGMMYAAFVNSKIRISNAALRIAPHVHQLMIGQDALDQDLALASLGLSYSQGLVHV